MLNGFHQNTDLKNRIENIKSLNDHSLLSLIFEVENENPELSAVLMALYDKMIGLHRKEIIRAMHR